MATMPGELMPPIAIVDYSAIDSGLGGPRIPSQSLAWTERQIGPASTVQDTTPGATAGATRLRRQSCCVYLHHREHDQQIDCQAGRDELSTSFKTAGATVAAPSRLDQTEATVRTRRGRLPAH